MSSRRRPGLDHTDTTHQATPAAPNYSGDDSETLIRVTPLPLREDDEDVSDELTMRRSTAMH